MNENAPASVPPEEPAHILTPKPSSSMSVVEVTGLINLFAGLLNTSTALILGRLDESAKMELERWAKHDAEAQRVYEETCKRFLTVETALSSHLTVASEHFTKKRDEEIILNARVKPVQTAVGMLLKNWRTILLFIVAALAVLGFSADMLRHLTGN